MEQEKMKQMLDLFSEMTAERERLGSLDAETKRNTANKDLFEAMIRETYDNIVWVAFGHHIMFTIEGEDTPREIASADTLIFNHNIASKVWKDRYVEVLQRLAAEPTETRDALLNRLYEERR